MLAQSIRNPTCLERFDLVPIQDPIVYLQTLFDNPCTVNEDAYNFIEC